MTPSGCEDAGICEGFGCKSGGGGGVDVGWEGGDGGFDIGGDGEGGCELWSEDIMSSSGGSW